jgi:hypothetical protein
MLFNQVNQVILLNITLTKVQLNTIMHKQQNLEERLKMIVDTSIPLLKVLCRIPNRKIIKHKVDALGISQMDLNFEEIT